MYVKKMKYIDFNGEERTEECCFNLTKAEMIDLEMTRRGGLAGMVQRITEEKDSVEIYKIFKDLVIRSYGVKSEDGRRFYKSKERTEDFLASQMYSDLIEELFTEPDAASEFVKRIVPQDMLEEYEKQESGKIKSIETVTEDK